MRARALLGGLLFFSFLLPDAEGGRSETFVDVTVNGVNNESSGINKYKSGLSPASPLVAVLDAQFSQKHALQRHKTQHEQHTSPPPLGISNSIQIQTLL